MPRQSLLVSVRNIVHCSSNRPYSPARLRLTLLRATVVLAVGTLVLGPIDAYGQRRSGSSRSSSGSVRVKGYYRKDGTYVQPHYRTRPDSSFNNNWSTVGNINPFTGVADDKDHPYGTWRPSGAGSRVYNTPIRQLNADFGKPGLLVGGGTQGPLSPGDRIVSVRQRDGSERAVKTWEELFDIVDSTDGDRVTLVVDRAGQRKEIPTQIESMEAWAPPATTGTEIQMSESLVVAHAPSESNLEAGEQIVSARLVGQLQVTKLGSFAEFKNFVARVTDQDVVLAGISSSGGHFEACVRPQFLRSVICVQEPPRVEAVSRYVLGFVDDHVQCVASKDQGRLPFGQRISGFGQSGSTTRALATKDDWAALAAVIESGRDFYLECTWDGGNSTLRLAMHKGDVTLWTPEGSGSSLPLPLESLIVGDTDGRPSILECDPSPLLKGQVVIAVRCAGAIDNMPISKSAEFAAFLKATTAREYVVTIQDAEGHAVMRVFKRSD